MTNKNTLPDWYPAKIHSRRLSLKEWIEELSIRTFFFEQLNNPKKDPRKVAPSKDSVSYAFIDIVINGNRNKVFQEVTPPIFHIPDIGEDEENQPFFEFTPKQFGSGFAIPIMINLDYDKDILLEHFEALIKDAHESLRSKEIHHFAFKDMFDNEELTKKFKHSVHAKGQTAYTEDQTKDWFSYKILDWIDLRLWCVLTERKNYSKQTLRDAFWSGHENGGHSLKDTTVPWAYELLNPKVTNQLKASENRDNKINFHTYLK